jgi:hypothetical protein
MDTTDKDADVVMGEDSQDVPMAHVAPDEGKEHDDDETMMDKFAKKRTPIPPYKWNDLFVPEFCFDDPVQMARVLSGGAMFSPEYTGLQEVGVRNNVLSAGNLSTVQYPSGTYMIFSLFAHDFVDYLVQDTFGEVDHGHIWAKWPITWKDDWDRFEDSHPNVAGKKCRRDMFICDNYTAFFLGYISSEEGVRMPVKEVEAYYHRESGLIQMMKITLDWDISAAWTEQDRDTAVAVMVRTLENAVGVRDKFKTEAAEYKHQMSTLGRAVYENILKMNITSSVSRNEDGSYRIDMVTEDEAGANQASSSESSTISSIEEVD